jgi:hypothetical protein
VKLKISKDTDRLIKHIFNFHLNMGQLCCSPTAFVSTVMTHLIERLLDRCSVYNYLIYGIILIINNCPIAVGVENPHKFWMCRQPRDVRQTSRHISTTAGSATYRRYWSHSCYEACGTFNYVTNAYCDGTIIYNDPV